MHRTTRAQKTKAGLCQTTAKDHSRVKSQLKERQKVFADHVSDMGLNLKIDKGLLQFNHKNQISRF